MSKVEPRYKVFVDRVSEAIDNATEKRNLANHEFLKVFITSWMGVDKKTYDAYAKAWDSVDALMVKALRKDNDKLYRRLYSIAKYKVDQANGIKAHEKREEVKGKVVGGVKKLFGRG